MSGGAYLPVAASRWRGCFAALARPARLLAADTSSGVRLVHGVGLRAGIGAAALLPLASPAALRPTWGTTRAPREASPVAARWTTRNHVPCEMPRLTRTACAFSQVSGFIWAAYATSASTAA